MTWIDTWNAASKSTMTLPVWIRRHGLKGIAGLLLLAEWLWGTRFGHLLLLLVISLASLGWLSRHWRQRGQHRLLAQSIRYGLWSLGGLWLLSFATVEYHLYHWQAPTTAPAPYLLVLGSGLRGDHPSALLRSRLEQAKVILQRYPEMLVVVSGGRGEDEQISEAQAMRQALLTAGIASERILLEDQSRNTAENILFSSQLLTARHHGQRPPIWLLTSEFHLYRASRQARLQQWPHGAIASVTPWWLLPYCSIREYFSLSRDWLQSLLSANTSSIPSRQP